MKQVLLIDESNVFRDYIKSKLEAKHIGVEFGKGQLDSLSKLRMSVPDLMILDYNSSRNFLFELLEGKKADANARDIPVIVLAQKIEKNDVTKLSGYNVKKIIPKPLKIDQFFQAVTDILHVDFDIDTTQCIMEARVNDNILFIEIAQGFNREKIELLKYRIRELIGLYNLTAPKILMMMTDLSLSFVDGPNLELLMESVMSDPSVKNRNIKILTLDGFTRDFIAGNKAYADIQVVTDLTKAIDSLLRDAVGVADTSTLISEKILQANGSADRDGSALEMRFKSEIEALKSVAHDIKIAVVDDDVVIRTVLAKTFQAINATVEQFESGVDFLPHAIAGTYDLIFLDLMMPVMNGLEVLVKMRENEIATPVIVLSSISQREAVLKVLSTGVRSYMIKPLKPEAILTKAIEVLQATI
ncbi:MAG TPA: response regulator [Treponemataceae bacterium]|nr:response regulator [Treponemataceae bacterium]